jgi:hypothetical protein
MGARFPFGVTNTIVNAALAAATETVAATTPPFSPTFDFSAVLLICYAAFHTGTGTTAVFYRVRRGTTTGGTQLGPVTPGTLVAASTFGYVTQLYFDTAVAIAGQQWSFTLQQGGGTGAGTIDDVCITAFAL